MKDLNLILQNHQLQKISSEGLETLAVLTQQEDAEEFSEVPCPVDYD